MKIILVFPGSFFASLTTQVQLHNQCTRAENENRGYADRITEAVNEISNIAARLADSADRGATIKFADARLRMAAREIEGKFERIESLADEADLAKAS